jgi:hypothetical protein
MDPFLTPPEVLVKSYLNSYQPRCPCRGARSGLRMVLWPPGDAVVPMVL